MASETMEISVAIAKAHANGLREGAEAMRERCAEDARRALAEGGQG